MLTSHRIDSTAPITAEQGALNESLPHGIPFSNIFSAMFGEHYAKTGGELSKAEPIQLAGLTDLNDIGLDSVDFSSLSVAELQQLLPQGLSADMLNQLDNLASSKLPELQTLSEKLQSLTDEIAKGEVSSLNASDLGQDSIAAKVNELNQIELPEAQITSELDRRGIANASSEAFSANYTVSDINVEALNLEDALVTSEQNLASQFNLASVSSMTAKEIKTHQEKIDVDNSFAEETIDVTELGFNASKSVNGVPVTGVDVANQAASQIGRQAQPTDILSMVRVFF